MNIRSHTIAAFILLAPANVMAGLDAEIAKWPTPAIESEQRVMFPGEGRGGKRNWCPPNYTLIHGDGELLCLEDWGVAHDRTVFWNYVTAVVFFAGVGFAIWRQSR